MKETAELVAAAQTIEDMQRNLEERAQALLKTKLHSEKNINRAARELQDAALQQEALAQSLQGLSKAMLHMQERQQAAMNTLTARAAEIQARRTRLSEHMVRYAELGVKAGQLLETIAASANASSAAAMVTATDTDLAAIVEDATTLARSASEDDFGEVSQEADVLKQKFQQLHAQLRSARSSN